MEIEKNYSILKACRFCPMCRHLCSSGNISMHESDFPRGRSLILYSVFRGEGYNRDYVNALFNCHMCGSCLAGCEGSFNLPELIRLSRMDIADEGMTPELIRKMKDNILKTENYFGENFTKSFTSGHSSEEKKNAEILYIAGQEINFRHHEIASAAIEVFKKTGVNFTVFSKEPDCGKILAITGFEKEAEKNAAAYYKKTIKTGASSIVTSDPLVYDCMKNDFKRWNLDYGSSSIRTMHFADFIEEVISGQKIPLKKYNEKTAVVDSEYLCKINQNCESYRKIMKKSAGENYVEFFRNRRYAGATGEAAFYYNEGPFLSWEQMTVPVFREALDLGVKTLVTLSGSAKGNFSRTSPHSIKVLDIAEFLLDVLA